MEARLRYSKFLQNWMKRAAEYVVLSKWLSGSVRKDKTGRAIAYVGFEQSGKGTANIDLPLWLSRFGSLDVALPRRLLNADRSTIVWKMFDFESEDPAGSHASSGQQSVQYFKLTSCFVNDQIDLLGGEHRLIPLPNTRANELVTFQRLRHRWAVICL
jgi:hypothetical protein